jgi:hypothetical protein
MAMFLVEYRAQMAAVRAERAISRAVEKAGANKG